MDFYQALASIGGIMVVLSTLPQVFKTLKTKEVKGLSLSMFVFLFLAQGIWLVYGLHLNDMPIIITNALSMLAVLTNIILIFIFTYRKATI